VGSVVADRVDCTNPGLSRSPDTQVLDACDRPQHTTKNRGEGRSEAGSAGIPRDVGPEAAGLTAGERLKLRKQKHKPARGRHAWYDANRRVHEVHNLVSSSNLEGPGAPTPNYPKNHVKKIKLTLPICKRDYVTHSRDRVQRKFRFPVFSKAPFDYNFLVI